jgi:hypothetical protein
VRDRDGVFRKTLRLPEAPAAVDFANQPDAEQRHHALNKTALPLGCSASAEMHNAISLC